MKKLLSVLYVIANNYTMTGETYMTLLLHMHIFYFKNKEFKY